MGFSKNSSKREDHIDNIIFQENKFNEIPNTTPRLEKKKKLKQGAKCGIKQ